MPRQEVRTPPFLLPICPQILQSINPWRQNRTRPGPLILLKELTGGHIGVGRRRSADPTGRQFPTSGIDRVPILLSQDPRVDAEVLPGGQAEGEGSGTVAEMGGLVIVEEFELGEGFLHFVDGAGAVDEFDRVVGFG